VRCAHLMCCCAASAGLLTKPKIDGAETPAATYPGGSVVTYSLEFEYFGLPFCVVVDGLPNTYELKFSSSGVQSVAITLPMTSQTVTLTTAFQGDMNHYQFAPVTLVIAGGSVSGDPQFVGFRGQQYQVHGMESMKD
jgi:hypothetical protein